VDRAKRIVIAAGGTAGHVVPALAVADALRADGAEISFVGAGRAEAQLVPAAGYELHAISVEGLSRTNPLLALRALLRAALALPRALALLRRLQPDAVMGGGGYVAGPVALAAIALRVPVVLTEADSHMGLTNRLLAPFAARVCLAFPPPARSRRPRLRLPDRRGGRVLVTGRPVPTPARALDAARARLGIGPEEACVLVFGGSLGASSINRAAADAFTAGLAPPIGPSSTTGSLPPGSAFRVLHISGRRDYAELLARELPRGYEVHEFLDRDDFADALAAADLAVARAGGSVFEIAAHGVPAILVPYPHAAGDHQSSNARWMADAGAAVVIEDEALSGARLAVEVAKLLSDRPRLAAMAAAARGLARPDAARDVAGQLLEVAAG
jgi:UDP-N-acetylglucosamine--N-acetylmuramyl-(pentapeptide) pyrophosphoryl-undecaprenol N-acetylglucosamine transferase